MRPRKRLHQWHYPTVPSLDSTKMHGLSCYQVAKPKAGKPRKRVNISINRSTFAYPHKLFTPRRFRSFDQLLLCHGAERVAGVASKFRIPWQQPTENLASY